MAEAEETKRKNKRYKAKRTFDVAAYEEVNVLVTGFGVSKAYSKSKGLSAIPHRR